MANLVIVGPNLTRIESPTGATFIVHAAGCADLRRLRYCDGFNLEADTQIEVCDVTYPPEDFECESGQYLGEFHFAPCCKLPVGVPDA
jgi:hypothetical protein